MNRSIIKYFEIYLNEEFSLFPKDSSHSSYNKVSSFKNSTMNKQADKIYPYANAARLTNTARTIGKVGLNYVKTGGPLRTLGLGLSTVPIVMKKMAQGGDSTAGELYKTKPSL